MPSFFEKRKDISKSEKPMDFLKRLKTSRHSSPSASPSLQSSPPSPHTSLPNADTAAVARTLKPAPRNLGQQPLLVSPPLAPRQLAPAQPDLRTFSQPASHAQGTHHGLYCKTCATPLADLNPLLPPPRTEIAKEYFCLLADRMLKCKPDPDDLRIVSPVNAYLLRYAMLQQAHCGALPPEGLPPSIREDKQQRGSQMIMSKNSKLSIWAPKDRYLPFQE